MIDAMSGSYRMLDGADVAAALAQWRELASPNEVLVHGSEAEIAELSRRVKLGASEIERRKARRRQQSASRRANRR